jgi:hypothetical protein
VKWAIVIVLALAGCSDTANTQYLPVGSRCSSSTQCGTAPYNCAVSGYPYGYCDKSCATNGDCPADSACSPLAKACRRTCTDSSTCRVSDGYRCQSLVGGTSVCETGGSLDGGSP